MPAAPEGAGFASRFMVIAAPEGALNLDAVLQFVAFRLVCDVLAYLFFVPAFRRIFLPSFRSTYLGFCT